MAFYKWNSCYKRFGFNKTPHLSINSSTQNRVVIWIGYSLIFSPDFYIGIEVQGGSNHDPQHHLAKDFELARQSVAISFFISNPFLLCHLFSTQLQIIINKTNSTEPNRAKNH